MKDVFVLLMNLFLSGYYYFEHNINNYISKVIKKRNIVVKTWSNGRPNVGLMGESN